MSQEYAFSGLVVLQPSNTNRQTKDRSLIPPTRTFSAPPLLPLPVVTTQRRTALVLFWLVFLKSPGYLAVPFPHLQYCLNPPFLFWLSTFPLTCSSGRGGCHHTLFCPTTGDCWTHEDEQRYSEQRTGSQMGKYMHSEKLPATLSSSASAGAPCSE